MQLETVLLFETVDEVYARVFRTLKPRAVLPRITVRFRKYANANSRIQLDDGHLQVYISDLLEHAPAPIQEALASILLSKLFRKLPESGMIARYRRYLNRADVRRALDSAKRERGRKTFQDPRGKVHDLGQIFEELSFKYFNGLMARPHLGWSLKPSRTILGHYDPAHNAIVLSSALDSRAASPLLVKFIVFHEMLHLKYPAEHRGARRCVHTPSFKQAERAFDEYANAREELREFVAR